MTRLRCISISALRGMMLASLVLCAVCAQAPLARAADKVTFVTGWFAQAEHGGFYMAKAEGLYDKEGLDVTIRQGGPQVNAMQLLLAGEVDFMMGYDSQVLKALEQGLPVTTVATSFQNELVGILTHEDVHSLDDLKGKPIAISTSSRLSFWPWFKKRYGFGEDQARTYTGSLQPFFADPAYAQQGYVTAEPYTASQAGQKGNFFRLSDAGYPPYGSTIVATRAYIEKNPGITARFVKASLQGWVDYLKNPEPANALIRSENPKEPQGKIDFAVKTLRDIHAVDGGDAAKLGVGIITAERFEATRNLLVESGLLRGDVDWRLAFVDTFVKGLKIEP